MKSGSTHRQQSVLIVHGKVQYGTHKVSHKTANKIKRTGKRIKKGKIQL
jgi:hypothetical protein